MNNRQNGRRRGRTNQRQPGRGGNQDNGNRIDSRARGNAAQLLEKYKNMARDAQLEGDRVKTEYYLQFADHYFRVLSDSRSRQEEQRARFEDREDNRDHDGNIDGDSDIDGDVTRADGDEGDDFAPRRNNRNDRNDRGERNDRGDRNDRGNRGDRTERSDRNDRTERAERNERSDRGERTDRNDRTERAERAPRDGDDAERAPRRTTRQPRAPREQAPRNRDNDEESLGIDLAVLPPAIGVEPARDEEFVVDAADATVTELPAPKRRGRPKKVADNSDGGEAAA